MTKPWRNITTIWSDKKNCVFVFISVNLTGDSTENQVKLHNIDQVSDFVDEHQHGIQEFDPQLVRRLIEKITIFQRYMEFMFKDGEVIKVKM